MQDSGVLLKATGSIKRKRGLKPQKASNNDMEIVENGQILEMEEPKCRMCNKIYADSSELNNLSNNKIMQKNLKSFVQVEDIQDFLTSICNSCLFKINSAKEIERTLRRRIKSKKCENQDILPIDTPLSINVQPQNCNYEQQDAMHKAECNDVLNISLTPPLYSPHNGHDYDEVHASPQEDLNISNTNESSNTDKQSTKTQANMLDNISNGNLSMLEVFCEHTESALITESGGKINNYRKSPPIVKQMICQYCQKIYYRKNYFAKHLKRCQANGRKFKNNLVNGSAKTGLDTSVDEYAENNIGDPMPSSLYDQELQRAQDHRKLLFQCKECAVKVDNIGKLRKHRKIHLKRFFCDICNGEFTTMHNYEFHRIECEAKLAVRSIPQLQNAWIQTNILILIVFIDSKLCHTGDII